MTASGADPNTSLFKFILPTPLGNRNNVEVESTLQVRGHSSIFAAGDIVNLPEVKQFSKTSGHAKVVVANIMSYLQGRQLEKQYKHGREIIVVSNGRVSPLLPCQCFTVVPINDTSQCRQNGGSSYFDVLWGLQLGNMFTKFIKSRILSRVARNNLGLVDR